MTKMVIFLLFPAISLVVPSMKYICYSSDAFKPVDGCRLRSLVPFLK